MPRNCDNADACCFYTAPVKRALTLTFLALAPVPAQLSIAQLPEEQPALEGIVTRLASSSDFDVNTIHVLCGNNTSSGWSNSPVSYSGCPKQTPKLGETITIFGTLHRDQNTVGATRILQHPEKLRGEVSGNAVVDAPPIRNAPGFPAGTIMVRADGYWIVLPFKADISVWAPMKSVEEVNTNTWIEYAGKMRPDGVVVARGGWLMPNILSDQEEKRRTKTHYDPAAASNQPKQSSIGMAMTGVSLKRVPQWPDTAMQARVEKVGNSLIPKYQKQLPASDPAKLAFRFIVVDANWGEFPLSLPDGTVLVPYKGVQRMQNDAQLAALLADAVAIPMEKQSLRMEAALRTYSAKKLAADAAYTALGMPLLIAAAWTDEQRRILNREMAQSERVSLMLMHDAGYDITQAPMAWWLIAAGKKPLSETPPPAQTIELYRTIAAQWSQPQPTAPPTP